MRLRLLSLLSAALLLALLASAAPTTADVTGVTTRVSLATNGAQGNAASYAPAISADGRIVAFVSDARTLVEGDTNRVADIFVRDQATGVTTRVSVASDGTQANGDSDKPALSADGRYVVFQSRASNLVAGDTNDLSDVFVHDRVTGQTTRVSVASDGSQGNNSSLNPSISADGRYVAFASDAGNLVAGDTNGVRDVFVRDRVANTTTRVSVATGGAQGNDNSVTPAISANGRSVVFVSWATNLVTGDTNGYRDIFVHDLTTGVTSRVSLALGGGEPNGDSYAPAISGDGSIVAFASRATNLVAGDTNHLDDVFVRDLGTGVTTRVSVASGGGQANCPSDSPAISADGRLVAFTSLANNLVAGDTNGAVDVFVHERATGVTTRVSVASDGLQGNNDSYSPSLSADGRLVAFTSLASNLVPGDTNNTNDVFVRDRCPSGACPVRWRARRQPDFDGNGQADLLWRNAATGQNAVWLMNGPNPPTMVPTTSVTDLAWKMVGLGDVDNDGKTNIVWRNSATGQNVLWFMNGATVTGYAFLPTLPDPAWQVVGVGDLDGDRQDDILWRNTATGQNVVWFMNGGTLASYAFLPSVTDPAWTLVGLGDLNFDNRVDLVWRNTATGQNIAWLMNGATVATYAWLPSVSDTAWQVAGSGDLNGDEMADLVWRNTATGENLGWLMDGATLASFAWLPTIADQNWKLVAVSDLNGDLKADLVWRNFATGQNNAWFMDGLTIKGSTAFLTIAGPDWRVVSPTSLTAGQNGLLPGPAKRDAAAPDAKPARPMATEAPQRVAPVWRAPDPNAPPMWGDAPQDRQPFWSSVDATADPPTGMAIEKGEGQR